GRRTGRLRPRGPARPPAARATPAAGRGGHEPPAGGRLGATVGRRFPAGRGGGTRPQVGGGGAPPEPPLPQRKPESPLRRPSGPPPPRSGEERQTLDSTWDRKLSRGTVEPDFTLDLHGHTLDGAHARLDQGLTQAKACGARVVLLITGKPRPAEAA